jgi:quinol monooxygenase YgiN
VIEFQLEPLTGRARHPPQVLAEPQPERDYVVVLTFLPLRRLSKLPRFLSYVRKIRQQLDAPPEGLIGYSLLAKPLRSNYWTLSVWEDEAALGRFIQGAPHRDAMRELPKVLSGFRTTRWTSMGSVGPPTWSDALARGELRPGT